MIASILQLLARFAPLRSLFSPTLCSRRRAPLMAATRDRLWTLLRRRHDELRRAGLELFGERGVDAQVPRLGVRAKAPATRAA